MVWSIFMNFLKFCVWNQMPWTNGEKYYDLETFCTYFSNNSTDSQNLWCGSIVLKSILIFKNNFLDFRFDTIEKQGIINLSSYGTKSKACVVLSDSDVAFLGKREWCSLSSSSLLCFLYTQGCIIEEIYRQIFLSSIHQEQFRLDLQLFCF